MRKFLVLLLLLASVPVLATHLVAAELTYRHISGFQYEVIGIVWVDTSNPATIPFILLNNDTVYMSNIQLFPTGPCGELQRNEYSTNISFPGPGSYLIEFELLNRNSGILNIPNSSQEPLSIKAELHVNPTTGPNNSVEFTIRPNIIWNQWSVLYHDPGVVDVDGDSLSFSLAIPSGLSGIPISGYQFPHDVAPPSTYSWVDSSTGLFTWDYPLMVGEYVIAIEVSEWRNEILVGKTRRDMMICISDLTPYTSIAESSLESGFGFVPNGPNQFMVSDEDGKVPQLTITDISGRIVFSENVRDGTLVDLSEQAQGMYSLTFVGDGFKEVHRVVNQ